jgi:tetratricopeptide (TPR) repeat protein
MRRSIRIAGCAVVFAGSLGLAPAAVQAMGSIDPPAASRDNRMADAEKAVQAKDWNKAIGLLNRVVADSPKNADAYNYLGYSHRKLGNRDQALTYYNHALYLDPNHRGALEYLGELYLDMSQLPQAEEQLMKLAKVCGPRCNEYRELQDQVAKFKAGQPRS